MTTETKKKVYHGRPKESPNKISKVLDEYIRNRLLHKSDLTPLEVMTEVMRRTFKACNYELALEAATRAAPYWHKKLPAAVEVSGADGADLLIQVVNFGDPEPVPTIDADQDTDEGVQPHVPTFTFPEVQQGVAVLSDATGDWIAIDIGEAACQSLRKPATKAPFPAVS